MDVPRYSYTLLCVFLLLCTREGEALSTKPSSRHDFVWSVASAVVAPFLFGPSAQAQEEGGGHLKDQYVKEVVKADLVDRQFLVNGNLTPSIYKPTATFTDEIDTYGMEQWMKGTQKLFVGEKSSVRLVGDVNVSPEQVDFRFDEDLMFRIPFRPVVSLSGKVVLKRDAEDGRITSYQEFWDEDVKTVLKTAKFNQS